MKPETVKHGYIPLLHGLRCYSRTGIREQTINQYLTTMKYNKMSLQQIRENKDNIKASADVILTHNQFLLLGMSKLVNSIESKLIRIHGFYTFNMGNTKYFVEN